MSARDDAEKAIEAARLMYHMDGWPRFWPFEKMPAWLAEKYLRPIEPELRLLASGGQP